MALPLDRVVALLDGIAPLDQAESWDNVGLLVAPLADRKDPAVPPAVERALVTIDLTDGVLDEALSAGADLIVSYHPPLFHPLKRLRPAVPAERRLIALARAGLAVYSPHTALDAAKGGVNDWLARGLGEGAVSPLVQGERLDPSQELKLVTFVPAEHTDRLAEALCAAGAGVIGEYDHCTSRTETVGTFRGSAATNPAVGERERLERVPEIRLELVCPKAALARVAEVMRDVHPYEEPAWDVYPLSGRPVLGVGSGRRVDLREPATLEAVVQRIKAHTGVPSARVAAAERHRSSAGIRAAAVCAGSGGSVLGRAKGVDLVVTGELSHHAVLAHVAEGKSVVLLEHSSSERGFLPEYAERLSQACEGAVDVRVAGSDREPIERW
jgi:dinuclear metal center YbgI/SA1388 family protein